MGEISLEHLFYYTIIIYVLQLTPRVKIANDSIILPLRDEQHPCVKLVRCIYFWSQESGADLRQYRNFKDNHILIKPLYTGFPCKEQN